MDSNTLPQAGASHNAVVDSGGTWSSTAGSDQLAVPGPDDPPRSEVALLATALVAGVRAPSAQTISPGRPRKFGL